MPHTRLAVYLSYLLRHKPEDLCLRMDAHGWVDAAPHPHTLQEDSP